MVNGCDIVPVGVSDRSIGTASKIHMSDTFEDTRRQFDIIKISNVLITFMLISLPDALQGL